MFPEEAFSRLENLGWIIVRWSHRRLITRVVQKILMIFDFFLQQIDQKWVSRNFRSIDFFSRVFIFHLKLNFDSIFRWARALGHKLEPRLHKSLVLLERWDKLQKTTMPAWITFSTLLKMVWHGMRKHFVCLVIDTSSDKRLSDGWAAVV